MKAPLLRLATTTAALLAASTACSSDDESSRTVSQQSVPIGGDASKAPICAEAKKQAEEDWQAQLNVLKNCDNEFEAPGVRGFYGPVVDEEKCGGGPIPIGCAAPFHPEPSAFGLCERDDVVSRVFTSTEIGDPVAANNPEGFEQQHISRVEQWFSETVESFCVPGSKETDTTTPNGVLCSSCSDTVAVCGDFNSCAETGFWAALTCEAAAFTYNETTVNGALQRWGCTGHPDICTMCDASNSDPGATDSFVSCGGP